jgi:Predicted integral membrane protein
MCQNGLAHRVRQLAQPLLLTGVVPATCGARCAGSLRGANDFGLAPEAEGQLETNSARQSAAAWAPRFWLVLRVGIAVLALLALRREITQIDGHAFGGAIASFGWRPIFVAVGCAIASFLALGLFEQLALRDTASYKGCEAAAKVPPGAAMLTSFVANAFSQSIGLAVVTGSAVRLRAYSRYGVGGAAIARVSGFVTLTATLGLLAAGGVAFFAAPSAVKIGHFALSMRTFGVLLSLPAFAYLAWAVVGKGILGVRSWSVRPPSRGLAFSQVALSVADWLLTGTVLFVLMPAAAAIGYAAFLGVYLVAQTVGVVSHVPADSASSKQRFSRSSARQ